MSLRLLAVAIGAVAMMGCGSNQPGFEEPDGGGDEGGNGDATDPFGKQDGSSDAPACVNLQCQQVTCSNGATTTVSGTVYAPNGTLPLYNVIVYVPNADLSPFPAGVSCDQCGVLSSGSPLVVALSDAQGHFQLKNVPVGSNIPLVMQVGKWRRKISIPTVNACVDNPVGQQSGGVEQLTRLPKNQQEGDMPKVAVVTGGPDKIACILPKIGIDSKEYAPGPTSSAVKPKTAISFYQGASGPSPAGSPPAKPFWDDPKQLENFDLAIFACEGYEPADTDATSYAAVRQYLEAGGRIFTTDYMYVWYKYSTDADINNAGGKFDWHGWAPPGGSPSTIDTTFAKGQALADWMYNVGSIAPYKTQVIQQPPIKGSFPANLPYGYTFDNVYTIDPTYGTEWAHSGPSGSPMSSPQHPRVVTMNMPSNQPPAKQCGKGVHLDLHVTQDDQVTSTYPSGCSNNMREPELITTFFLFDVSSCIQDDKQPPVPPVPN